MREHRTIAVNDFSGMKPKQVPAAIEWNGVAKAGIVLVANTINMICGTGRISRKVRPDHLEAIGGIVIVKKRWRELIKAVVWPIVGRRRVNDLTA